MKKLLLAFIPWLFAAFSGKAIAQENEGRKDEKKETQEIIIRKKGEKDANINIQITGDKVIINGKPLMEFKDNELTINKRKIIVKDGDSWVFGDGKNPGRFSWSDEDGSSKPFLGVTTEKAGDGVKITHLSGGSSAEKAGLREGDEILKIDDTKIDGPETLMKTIKGKKPKDNVQINYLRDGKQLTAKATLQEVKTSRVFSFSAPDGSTRSLSIPPMHGGDEEEEMFENLRQDRGDFGPDFTPFPPKQKLGLKIQDTDDGNGLKVLEVENNSPASISGLKQDDIITEIAGVKVKNTDEAREQLRENNEKSNYTIKARRSSKEMSFEIKIPKKLKTVNL